MMPSSCMKATADGSAGLLDENDRIGGQARLLQPVTKRPGDGPLVPWPTRILATAAALPDLRHSPAASLVTLGRFS